MIVKTPAEPHRGVAWDFEGVHTAQKLGRPSARIFFVNLGSPMEMPFTTNYCIFRGIYK